MKQTFDTQVRAIVSEVTYALETADKAYGQVTSKIKTLLGNKLDDAKVLWKGVRDSAVYKAASERVQATIRQAAARHLKAIDPTPAAPKAKKGKTGANTSGKAKGGAAVVISRNNWRAEMWKLLETCKQVMPEEAYTELGAVLNKYAK